MGELLHSEISEAVRFRPSPESLAVIKDVRSKLRVVQQKNPTIRGIAIFGSRVLGVEKEDSDVDIVVFYDSEIQKRTQMGFTTENIKKNFKVDKPLGTHREGPWEYSSQHFFALDISRPALNKTINEFVQRTSNLTHQFKNEMDVADLNWRMGHDALSFAALFFLSVGDPVYQARKYVLDKLEQLPNGDAYFAELMRLVSYLEREISNKRTLPVYTNYPKTISEARHYFVLKEESKHQDYLSPEIEEFCKSHRVGIAFKKIVNGLADMLANKF